MHARHVLGLGMIWRVGNGKSIVIRGDKWLPRTFAPKVVSPASVLPPDSRVCDLIDQATHTWKKGLIAQEFLPHEASPIIGLPLSLQVTPDRQVWLPSANGDFSTQSAYQLLATSSRAANPSSSSNSRGKSLWKGIWNLQAPQKVKHLLWRAANEAIPTVLNLWKRRVVNVACCPMCKAESEDTIHALWGCSSLSAIWYPHEELKKMVRLKFGVFSDLLEVVFSRQSCVDVEVLAMMFWLIWNNRNAKRCGGEIIDNHLIRSKAESLISEFRTAQVTLRKPSVAATRAVRWIPPEPPSYKINFDGVVFKELSSAGMGVVVRDSSGRVIGALAEKIPLPNAIATVEALACRRAMIFAKELGLFDCVFEGDAEVIVKAIQMEDSTHPKYGQVLSDVLFLAADFCVCTFSHVKRAGNSVAHFLARQCKSGDELQVWSESILEDIAPLVARDAL